MSDCPGKQQPARLLKPRGSHTIFPIPMTPSIAYSPRWSFITLTHKRKVESLHEVRRILKPGGALFIVDFGKPATAIGAALVKLVHHAEHIRDHIEGDLVEIIRSAGLVGA